MPNDEIVSPPVWGQIQHVDLPINVGFNAEPFGNDVPIEVADAEPPAGEFIEFAPPQPNSNNHLVDLPLNLNLNNMPWEDDWPEICMTSNSDGSQFVISKRKAAKKQFLKIADCASCKNTLYEDGKTSYYRTGKLNKLGLREEIVCQKCIPSYSTCECCQFYFKSGDLQYGHCPNCVEKASARLIMNYHTKAEQKFKKQGSSLDQLFFGVEMEYASTRLNLDTLIVHNLIKDFAILKRDSSIKINDVVSGFEIVSCPCTLDFHAKNWENFLINLPESTFPNESCGMHVHVSRVFLGDLQIGKIISFIYNPDNRPYIETIAERPSGHHNNFHDPRSIKEGREGGFAYARDRHSALNLNNKHTIEFRLFASTKSYPTLMKNIEFCRAMVKFTNIGEYSLKESKSFDTFFKFICRNRKEFPFLHRFLVSTPIFAGFEKK